MKSKRIQENKQIPNNDNQEIIASQNKLEED